MQSHLFTGSAVALVTPFGPKGVDEACLADLVRFHLREQTDALVVNGSTGEAAAMSPAEQRRVIEVAASVVGGQVPVITGVGGTDTAAVSGLARAAREAGADAVLISPPRDAREFIHMLGQRLGISTKRVAGAIALLERTAAGT